MSAVDYALTFDGPVEMEPTFMEPAAVGTWVDAARLATDPGSYLEPLSEDHARGLLCGLDDCDEDPPWLVAPQSTEDFHFRIVTLLGSRIAISPVVFVATANNVCSSHVVPRRVPEGELVRFDVEVTEFCEDSDDDDEPYTSRHTILVDPASGEVSSF